jgi:hypothetical protein
MLLIDEYARAARRRATSALLGLFRVRYTGVPASRHYASTPELEAYGWVLFPQVSRYLEVFRYLDKYETFLRLGTKWDLKSMDKIN